MNVETIFILSAALIVAVLALVLRIALRRSARAASLERNAEGAYRASVARAERRSQSIVHRAVEQARGLAVRSELAEIKEHAKETLEHRALHEKVRDEVEKLRESVVAEFSRSASEARDAHAHTLERITDELAGVCKESREALEQARASYEQFLSAARADIAAAQSEGKSAAAQALAAYAAGASQELRDLGRSASALLKERVEEELAAARAELAGYREAQQRMLDERIVELVERTAAIALTESLSLAEHARLVYRALEEARREGFFGKISNS